MSVHALTWAMQTTTGSASKKLILLTLANFANEAGEAYPSYETLCGITELNRKTVAAALAALVADGLICDSGERRGATKQVIVYRLLMVPGERRTVPKTGRLNSTENGTVPKTEQYRFYHETVPFLDGNSTENGTRILKGNVREPSVNSSLSHSLQTDEKETPAPTPKKRSVSEPRGARLPADWRPSAADLGWAAASLPDVDTDDATARFCDYWQAASGQSARKSDWSAAWRNWLRNAADRRQSLKPASLSRPASAAPIRMTAAEQRREAARESMREEYARRDALWEQMQAGQRTQRFDPLTIPGGFEP